jgi:potassium inwardly-rectifying channel subfamily J
MFTSLLDLSWSQILFLFVFCFVTSWFIFAGIWYLIIFVHGDLSTNQLNKTDRNRIPCVVGVKSFSGALLYSIETQQTIGYGTRAVTEECTSGVILLIIQCCFGLLIQALWVGLVYTKLSRPSKRRRTLIWSEQSVISLRDGYLTLQCRLGDMRHRSTLVEAHIRMYFISKRRTRENEVIPLNLLDMNVGYDAGRDRLFFNWPIIIEHKIDNQSPLYDMDRETILKRKFEILLILEGIIEPTGMITQAKTSYMPQEIVWGSRFQRMINFKEGLYTVDYSKFNSIYNDNCTPNSSAKQLDEQNQNNNY